MNTLEAWKALTEASKVYYVKLTGLIIATVVDNFFDLSSSESKDLYDYLVFAAELENGLHDNTGKIRGLFQFSEVAWRDVNMSDWSTNAIDPMLSTRAAALFYFKNKARHERSFASPYTKEVAYLYHNQGPSAAAKFLRSRELVYPGQSIAALQVFENIG